MYQGNRSPWKRIAKKVIRGEGPLSRREIGFYRRHRPEYDRFFESHRIDPRIGIDGRIEYERPGRTRHYGNPDGNGEFPPYEPFGPERFGEGIVISGPKQTRMYQLLAAVKALELEVRTGIRISARSHIAKVVRRLLILTTRSKARLLAEAEPKVTRILEGREPLPGFPEEPYAWTGGAPGGPSLENPMKLMTKELERRFAEVGSQEDKGDQAVVIAKFFTPDSNWTWWATEYDPRERIFFGLVQGFEVEFGSFSLDELASVHGPMGLPIERDLHWQEKTLGEVRAGLFRGNPDGNGSPAGPVPVDLMAALTAIQSAARMKPGSFLDYAAAYVEPIMDGRVSPGDIEAMRVQLLYIKSNLGPWRGPEAKAAKVVIDRYLKRYKANIG